MAFDRATRHASSAEHLRRLAFLAEHEELDLLEWIALYRFTDGALNDSALQWLRALDAPQWIRVAVWLLDHPDAHKREAIERMLVGDEVRSWIASYPSVQRLPHVEKVFARLETDGAARVNVDRFLPPLDPSAVLLAFLDAPPALAELGDAARAAPGKRYVHQVLRAIDGLAVKPMHGWPWLGKLLALTRHAHPAVRRQALQAFTRYPPEQVPHRELMAVADDATMSDSDREWALLAASYSRHARPFVALLRIAAAPDHPAWSAAASRLGDTGDAIAFGVLTAAAGAVSGPKGKLAESSLARIAKRAQSPDDEVASLEVVRILERIGWADIEGEADVEAWRRHADARLAELAKRPRVRAELQAVAAAYTADTTLYAEPQAKMLRERVRRHALRHAAH